MRIILLGAPFMMGQFVINNQLRFQGSAMYAMVGLMCGAVINVILDPILILGLKWGVTGAAIATVSGQITSFFVLMIGSRKGENIRRDVCLTLEQMGIQPVSSRHESGCGQHEIDFNSSSALKAADTFLSFKSAVKSVAETHGVHASFMPKPLRNDCGNGMHISFTVFPDSDFLEEHGSEYSGIVKSAAAGIMDHIREFTFLTNSTVNSYARLGEFTAPRDIIWSDEEGSQLIRMSPDSDDVSVELRVADCVCDPYLVLGLMIYSALEGISSGAALPEKNTGSERLPVTLEAAADIAESSEFLKKYVPANILEVLIGRQIRNSEPFIDPDFGQASLHAPFRDDEVGGLFFVILSSQREQSAYARTIRVDRTSPVLSQEVTALSIFLHHKVRKDHSFLDMQVNARSHKFFKSFPGKKAHLPYVIGIQNDRV